MTIRTFVTGGSSGIGASIVRLLAAQGHHVTFTYHASQQAAMEIEEECSAHGGRAVGLQVDLAEASAVAEAAEAAVSGGARFDGFVHCAGRSHDALSMAADLDRCRALMQVNLWSMVGFYQKLVRPMMAARRGRIILIGSIAATRGGRGNAFYAMSKSALSGFMHSVVDELAPRGVTINLISPGYVGTPMLEKYGARQAAMEMRIPARRYGRPEDIAAVVAFLLSDPAGYLNGATIAVDGGLSAVLGMAS